MKWPHMDGPDLALGFGVVFGRVVRASDQPKAMGPLEDAILVFGHLPLSEELEAAARSGCRAIVIPPVSSYSHFTSRIWSVGLPTYSTSRHQEFLAGQHACIDFDKESFAVGLQAPRIAEPSLTVVEKTVGMTETVFLGELSSVAAMSSVAPGTCDGIGVVKCEELLAVGSTRGTLEAFQDSFSDFSPQRPLYLRFFDVADSGPSPLDTPLSSSLGTRGARLLESAGDHLCVFKDLLQRLHVPVVVVLPMVASPEEIELARRLFAGLVVGIGATIETPSAALLIDRIAPQLHFVEIGLNDLTQYTTAWHRDVPHPTLHPARAINPAVARLASEVANNCRRSNIPCALGLDLKPNRALAKQIVDLGISTISCALPLIPHWRRHLLVSD